MRHTRKIEVGMFEQRVGFTLYFEDDSKEHFLFAPDIAEDLAAKLAQSVKDLRYVQEALRVPGDKVGVSDSVSVRLSTPEEVKEDGEEAEQER